MNKERELYLRERYAEQISEAEGFYDGFKYGRCYARRDERYYLEDPYPEDSIESWAYWVEMTAEPDTDFIEEVVPDWWNDDILAREEDPDFAGYENEVLLVDRNDLIELLLDYITMEHNFYYQDAQEDFFARWNISYEKWKETHKEN